MAADETPKCPDCGAEMPDTITEVEVEISVRPTGRTRTVTREEAMDRASDSARRMKEAQRNGYFDRPLRDRN